MKDRDFLIGIARDDFGVFVQLVVQGLEREMVWGKYLDLLCDKVERLIKGETNRLSVNLPPRHLKTIVSSVCATAFELGRNPESRVICATHSLTLSRDIYRKIVSVLESEIYSQIFPRLRLQTNSSQNLELTTSRGGGVLLASLDSSLTGRGADLIIVDDPHSANEVHSATERQNTIRAFDEMLVPRLNHLRTGRILVVGQRLHEQDLSAHVMAKGYESLSLPFQATRSECIGFRSGYFRREEEDVLHPERYGPIEVASLKRTTPPHVFSTQYQQAPRGISSGDISEEDFPLYDEIPDAGETILSWDVASTTNVDSSNSVCLVFQRIRSNHYLKEVWKGRLSYQPLKAIAHGLETRYHPLRHLIENASLGPALAGDLSSWGASVELLNTRSLSKQARLEEQFHIIKGRGVHLPREGSWRKDFLEELMSFPYGSRDDQVDALSQYLRWTTTGPGGKPTVPPMSIGIGGARGGRRTDSARYADMIIRSKTRRW